MSILLTGDAEQVKRWGRRQFPRALSFRDVSSGASPATAEDFTRLSLRLVHEALSDLHTYVTEDARPYLIVYLHDAIVTAPFSRWVAYEDDVRHLVALELAQRARNALAHGLVEPSQHAATLKPDFQRALRKLSRPSRPRKTRVRVPPELIAYIHGRVLEDLSEDSAHHTYLSKLERLRSGFGLNQQELARLLRLAPESIRKWIRGGGISPNVRGTIDAYLGLLDRLQSYLRPGLLPAVLRRPARGLGGRRPVELLLEGKGELVVEYFEDLTTYASTA